MSKVLFHRANRKKLPGWSYALLILMLIGWYSLSEITPPPLSDSTSTPQQFSIDRALSHLEHITTRRRTPGEEFHKKSGDYLLSELQALAIDAHIQTTTILDRQVNMVPFKSADVRNVVGRIPGYDSTGALIFVAHYDSVPSGPGAGDTAMGVVALLEMARLIKTGPSLRNDIIVLFTDGHEFGLLGAKAFVGHHPWMEDTSMVFNFEGQGPYGPVYLFEANSNNYWMVKNYAKAVPYPFASSISQDVFDLLPFDNDFRIFMDANRMGLGFAIVSDMAYYHSSLDNYSRVDPRSLKHHGTNALGIATHFGQLDLTAAQRSQDGVHFNLSRHLLVHYPQSWIWPITAVIVLLLLCSLIVGTKKRMLQTRGIIFGLLALMLSVAVTIVIIFGIQQLLQLNRSSYHAVWFYGGFSLLAAGVLAGTVGLLSRRISPRELHSGIALFWLLPLVYTTLYMPGATYVFTWPLLISCLALNYRVWGSDKSVIAWGLQLLAAISAVLILLPLGWLLYPVLTLNMPYIAPVLMIYLGSLVTLVVPPKKGQGTPWIPGALLGTAIILLVIGSGLGYDQNSPQRNSILYSLNTDSNQAKWATNDRELDSWTRQFLGDNPNRGELSEIMPFFSYNFYYQDAPVLPLPAPQVEVITDQLIFDTRQLTLKITSPRQAPTVTVYLDHQTPLRESLVNGQRYTYRWLPQNYWALQHHGLTAEGISLTFVTEADQKIGIRVMDQSYTLPPDLDWAKRPLDMMMQPQPSYGHLSDTTIVSAHYQF